MAPAAALQENTGRGGRAPARICGAKTKQKGTPCKRGRGWGTGHPGYGNCKRHGGSTPSGVASAAKEAAVAAARADYAGEVELAPLDALLYTVRRGAQLVTFWQRAAMTAESEEAFALATANEAKALADLSTWSKRAVDGGVSTMQVEIVAGLAERIVAAAEDGLAGLERVLGRSLSAEERTAFVAPYGSALARIEAGGDIETTAHDA